MAFRKSVGVADHAREDEPKGHRPRHQSQERISFFTVPDIAEHLGVSTRTVRRWIDDKQLVAHHFGRAVRVSERDLRNFLATTRG
jgi:excisionase family DNA binding protein